MEKFIYVFDKESRDYLMAHNYKLLKSDKKNDIYAFANRTDLAFEMDEIYFVRSNTLSF